MAINILGTAPVQDCVDSGLPSLTLFDSSIEPMSIHSFFHNKRWCQLRKFTQASSGTNASGFEIHKTISSCIKFIQMDKICFDHFQTITAKPDPEFHRWFLLWN